MAAATAAWARFRYSEAPKQFFFNAFQNNRWAHPAYLTAWDKDRRSYLCSVPLPPEVRGVAVDVALGRCAV